MSKKGFIFLMAFSLFFVLTKGLFPGQDDQPIKITRLADKLYKVTATAEYSVNLLASIGEDGLLLVDTGLPHSGENLLRALKELKAGPPKIIINTHQHIDHTGNNDKFGKGVTLIGHRKLRYRLQSGPLIIYEIPDYAVPSVSFDDTMNVFFNGEEIRLFAATGSHTDTDIGVYFTTSGVAYLGDLAYGMHVPSFDRLSGDILEYGNAVKKALQYLPGNALIVSGHGTDCTMKDMKEFQRMLAGTIQTVKNEYAKGKSAETMIKEKILKEWDAAGGGESGYTIDNWITLLVGRLKNGKPTVVPPYELLFAAYKTGGTDGMVRTYRELRLKEKDKYLFEVRTLNYFGNYFRFNDKIDESIKLNIANTEEYPESYAAWYWLGDVYFNAGQNDKALEALKKGLKVDPGNTYLLDLMKKIKEKK